MSAREVTPRLFETLLLTPTDVITAYSPPVANNEIYDVIISDSVFAMLSGSKRNPVKHDLERSLAEAKPRYVTQRIHRMMYGKDLRGPEKLVRDPLETCAKADATKPRLAFSDGLDLIEEPIRRAACGSAELPPWNTLLYLFSWSYRKVDSQRRKDVGRGMRRGNRAAQRPKVRSPIQILVASYCCVFAASFSRRRLGFLVRSLEIGAVPSEAGYDADGSETFHDLRGRLGLGSVLLSGDATHLRRSPSRHGPGFKRVPA